jgi:dienelactone hydrolase
MSFCCGRRLVHSLSATTQTETRANVVVLIADVISDETGWGWHTEDRSRYLAARTELLQCSPSSSTLNDDNSNIHVVRRLLQDRIWAAVQLVQAHVAKSETAFSTTTAATTATIHWVALGWCLGGQAIAEMARLEPPRRHDDDPDQTHQWRQQ